MPRLTWKPSVKALKISVCGQTALKLADLGHLAAVPHVHPRWVDRLTEEFYQQGDKESARGMKVSPLMDRHQEGGLAKSQVSTYNDHACQAPYFRLRMPCCLLQSR